MNIKLKRIYDDPADDDGARYLVDRLWPRGVSKKDAHLDGWFKQVTPSANLRKWFDHDHDKWEEFKTAYREELSKRDDAINDMIDKLEDNHTNTLLYAAKDRDHTHAIVLKKFVEKEMQNND